jgi:3-oxoacyl-[acyl-carrier protein] reductase
LTAARRAWILPARQNIEEAGSMRLAGKTAIVTGGGSGFGAGIVELFVREGAKVVVADIDGAAAGKVASGAEGNGAAVPMQADVTRDDDTRRMVETALARFGRLDILVNNAGVSHWNQPLTEVSEADFDRVYAVNVKALYWAARHAVPVMAGQGGGAIINTASTAGLRPRPGLCWYNGSKGACITITKSMAVELAPQKIRVNALCPVAGDTPLLAHFMGGDTPENRARFIGTVPLGRLSTPLDVARAALWLASDEGEFITGVALEVDGGRCI